MDNLIKYNTVFNDVLDLKIDNLEKEIDEKLIPEWESITHLQLVTSIEDEFDLMLESEDILDFRSYAIGKEILKKYDIII